MDRIFIKNLSTKGILGIHSHEQQKPQEILISAAVTLDIVQSAQDDDISQTVNYSTLAKDILRFTEASHFLTIEAFIEALARQILADKRIQEVWLRVEKPNAVPAAESVGVEIIRKNSA